MGIREQLKNFLSKTAVPTDNLSDLELSRLVAIELGLPYYETAPEDMPHLSGVLEHPVVRAVPISKWKELTAIPKEITADSATVLVANPFQLELQRELTFLLGGKTVEIVMSSEQSISSILNCFGKVQNTNELKLQLDDSELIFTQKPVVEATHESTIKPEDVSAPLVIRLVNKIFSDALDSGTSDIHLTPTQKNLEVKIRIDGILKDLLTVPINLKLTVTARIKLLCGMDISERRKPQDGRLRLKTGSQPVDLRVSCVPSVYGETIVIRLLSTKISQVELDSLGMDKNLVGKVERALKSSSKVVLVAGPTGSGKTSTLYAALSHIADGTKNIITIEDPVEYRIEGITQMQVNNKTDMTFANGLRSALRQDPDVIMVGEIRDLETAQISMQAAQTGHLVLSTIHTNTAEGSITRLLDLGVPAYLIASSVTAIIAQRLVRRLQPDGTLSGRVGIFSMIEITPEVVDLIRCGAGEHEIINRASLQGFVPLWQHGQSLIDQGVTTYEEVERVLGPKPSLDHQTNNQTRINVNMSQGNVTHNPIAKRKILLVEDDDTSRTVLSMLFEDEFYEVIQASNGHEGLEKVYAHHPEIIVSDLMMPRMSGLEMLQKLKGDTRLSSIPVLMLTAAAHEENEIDLIKHGADDFVSKSADSKVLLARVERILNRASHS
jgi:type II secretory ATPase GspE/PulE/Tfp pilus assembly ATPase PilB-like protein/ActR/RegA family two-component response regulator